MCDGEGRLGDPDTARRTQAVDNHRKWIDAAKTLGCITIRVNAASEGSFDEQQKLAADGLARLTEIGAAAGINVIVENRVGANATIVCGATLGEYSFVGAGAVVTSDVPAYALMVGVPARRVGWVCRCGERLRLAGSFYHRDELAGQDTYVPDYVHH